MSGFNRRETPLARENPVTLQARESPFVRTKARDPRDEAEALPVLGANRNSPLLKQSIQTQAPKD